MSQNLRELIDAIEEGHSLRIQNAFEREMATRIASAIQERKMEIAQGIFESQEIDLDEAVKRTLKGGSKVSHPEHGKGTVHTVAMGGGNLVPKDSAIVKFADGKKRTVKVRHLTLHEDSEDLDTIEELSKHTLGRYINKAADKAMGHGYSAGVSPRPYDLEDLDKGIKRLKGINKAVKKLAKEELTPKQKQLDHDGDGKIEGGDLAKVRKHGAKKV